MASRKHRRAHLRSLRTVLLDAANEVVHPRNERFVEERKTTQETFTQVELQEDLQRFVSQFLEYLVQAAESITKKQDFSLQFISAHHLLRLASSMLDIAGGPYPEVNFLDMMAFVRLNKEVVEEYWIPKIYGETGSENLLAAFNEAERALDEIASDLLTPDQRGIFDGLIKSWRKKNPELKRVEWARITDFSKKAGQIASDRSEEARGLLAGVKAAVASADQAILLANRLVFLGQRMPFLLRLQARIAVQEIVSDSMMRLRRKEVREKAQQLLQNATKTIIAVGAACIVFFFIGSRLSKHQKR
jgi:hypothetical protein